MRAHSVSLALRSSALAAAISAATAALASAQCPGWDPAFGAQAQAGMVQAMQVFDDGTGPALYVGGAFTSMGGVSASNVARWNGTSWSAVGAITTGAVRAFALHDDGSGVALYAGGGPNSDIGGRVWRWDGAAWTQVGPTSSDTSVYGLASFDDGTGAKLYAASWGQILFPFGPFTRITRFDGVGWSEVLSTSGFAPLLAVHDEGLGSGPGLYVGGSFSSMTFNGSSVAALNLVRWDGMSLSPFQVTGPFTSGLGALHVFDDGTGPALYAGGLFETANGVPAHNVARLQAGNWSALGAGVGAGTESVGALAGFFDGSGPALYAAGNFLAAGGTAAERIARWDGASWSPLSSGIGGNTPLVLAAFDDGVDGDADLYAGGYFTSAGGFTANKIARWFGCATEVLCSGDGTLAPCPCANSGAAGRGCENSASTGGALLAASGSANPDTLVLSSSGELASALTIFLQGTATIAPIPFGDGLRCTGGNLKRLYVHNAVAGTVSAPQAGDPSITARCAALGAPIAPHSQRFYQAYYRDPAPGFCPAPQGSGFNASQALRIVW